jgi:hypothetical protein
MRQVFYLIGLIFIAAGCASRPTEDLVLADVALKSAQKVKADALAPDLFRRAENNFLRAKKDFTDGYFDSCRKHSNDARMLAEQAEYYALLKQSQTKDKPPAEEMPSSPPSGGGSTAAPAPGQNP